MIQDAPRNLPAKALVYWSCFAWAGARFGFAPTLIAAMCARETDFGTSRLLDKPGPAGRGDGGHGHGLFQIDDRWHLDWIKKLSPTDGLPLWVHPEENAAYAVGQVLAPAYRLLRDINLAVSAFNCGAGNVLKAIKELKASNPEATKLEIWTAADRYTAGGNYSSDVFGRAAAYLSGE